MSHKSNIKGTSESWFTIQVDDSDVGIGRDGGGNLLFKDKVVVGIKTLTELLAGGGAFQFTKILVPTGETWTVSANEQYIVHREVTIDGELVLDDGELVVF